MFLNNLKADYHKSILKTLYAIRSQLVRIWPDQSASREGGASYGQGSDKTQEATHINLLF